MKLVCAGGWHRPYGARRAGLIGLAAIAVTAPRWPDPARYPI
jgi:hypothetical protein